MYRPTSETIRERSEDTREMFHDYLPKEVVKEAVCIMVILKLEAMIVFYFNVGKLT